jgi:hypothetical protein
VKRQETLIVCSPISEKISFVCLKIFHLKRLGREVERGRGKGEGNFDEGSETVMRIQMMTTEHNHTFSNESQSPWRNKMRT